MLTPKLWALLNLACRDTSFGTLQVQSDTSLFVFGEVGQFVTEEEEEEERNTKHYFKVGLTKLLVLITIMAEIINEV